MGKKKQKITLTTDGTHRNTHLVIDDKEIKFESLNLSGSKESDYDIIVGLSTSKVTKEQIKQAGKCDAVGFIHEVEEDYEDDE